MFVFQVFFSFFLEIYSSGSIPSQGPRPTCTKDVIKMVPVVPLFSTEHLKGKILALSQEN